MKKSSLVFEDFWKFNHLFFKCCSTYATMIPCNAISPRPIERMAMLEEDVMSLCVCSLQSLHLKVRSADLGLTILQDKHVLLVYVSSGAISFVPKRCNFLERIIVNLDNAINCIYEWRWWYWLINTTTLLGGRANSDASFAFNERLKSMIVSGRGVTSRKNWK